MGRRSPQLRQHSLPQLELLLAAYLPPGLLSQADEGSNSRERVFTLRRTFFGFLYQVLNPNCPCRQIVQQIQALLVLDGSKRQIKGTSAYCQARLRLPLDKLQRLRVVLAAAAQKSCQLWHGFSVKLIDGTSTSLSDTVKNQRAYPQPGGQKPGCGFPLLMEVLGCLSPAMVHKELEMFFIAYNFIRCLMAQAASVHGVGLQRLSFKGTVDAVRQFSAAIAQARTKKKQRELIDKLFAILAQDQVPERPGRREPRAVKRRPKPFPLLTGRGENTKRPATGTATGKITLENGSLN